MDRVLTFAFCDDDASDRVALHGLCAGLLDRLGMQARFFDFSSAMALETADVSGVDLIFLDIEMPGEDGISAARAVRRTNSAVPIVFVTAHPNYAIEGYGVGAYRYLLKPVDEKGFCLDMAPLFQELAHETDGSVVVRCDDQVCVVSLRDVMYVTTAPQPKRLLVTTTRGVLECADSLKRWEQMVAQAGSTDFFRCHGSALINFRYLRNIRQAEVVMEDGAALPLGKRRRRDLSEAALRYRGFHA